MFTECVESVYGLYLMWCDHLKLNIPKGSVLVQHMSHLWGFSAIQLYHAHNVNIWDYAYRSIRALLGHTPVGFWGNRCQLNHGGFPSMKKYTCRHEISKPPHVADPTPASSETILGQRLLPTYTEKPQSQCIQIYQLHNWYLECC